MVHATRRRPGISNTGIDKFLPDIERACAQGLALANAAPPSETCLSAVIVMVRAVRRDSSGEIVRDESVAVSLPAGEAPDL